MVDTESDNNVKIKKEPQTFLFFKLTVGLYLHWIAHKYLETEQNWRSSRTKEEWQENVGRSNSVDWALHER